MRWSRKLAHLGDTRKFDSFSYGKTYTILHEVLLHKKVLMLLFHEKTQKQNENVPDLQKKVRQMNIAKSRNNG